MSTFRIEDINTFLYDVKIKGENIAFHSDPPEVFQLFFDTEKFSKAAPAGAVPFTPPVTFEDFVRQYDDDLRELEFTKQLYDDMVLTIYTDDKKQADIKQEVWAADPTNKVLSGAATTRSTLLVKCQALYNSVQATFASADATFKALAPPTADQIKRYTELQVSQGKVKEFKYKELFGNLARLYDNLNNPASFEVVSSPIIAQKDLITYQIEITPKKSLPQGNPKREENFSVPIPVKGGAKIDFSTGLFFTLGDQVADRSYRLDSISPTEKKVVETSAQNQFVPSVGAMMHVSFRALSWVKPCFSLGLGLKSTNLENTSYFIGLGLIMGREERVILSGGFAGSRVSYLKRSFDDGQNVPFSTKTDDLTEKTFRRGSLLSFFAITYNLTSKKKE